MWEECTSINLAKMYDAKPGTAAKKHNLIQAPSRKPRSIQRGNLVPKRHNYVLITPTNASKTHILDLISLTSCHHWIPLSQRASYPPPLDFHADSWGVIPAEIPWWFPCGNSGEMKGNFLFVYFASFPCGIPGDISTWKFPSRFPQKFQNAI